MCVTRQPSAIFSLFRPNGYPPEPQDIEKTVFHDFSTFSSVRLFFLLTLSLLSLSLF